MNLYCVLHAKQRTLTWKVHVMCGTHHWNNGASYFEAECGNSSNLSPSLNMSQYDMWQYDMSQYDMSQYDMSQYDMLQYAMSQYDMAYSIVSTILGILFVS